MKKTRNWSEYNESLVNRGSITFRFRDDASVVPELLAQIDDKIGSLYGDGAYDKRRVYKTPS